MFDAAPTKKASDFFKGPKNFIKFLPLVQHSDGTLAHCLSGALMTTYYVEGDSDIQGKHYNRLEHVASVMTESEIARAKSGAHYGRNMETQFLPVHFNNHDDTTWVEVRDLLIRAGY